MEKKSKSMLAIIAVAALILVIGGTYAFITFVLEGTKQNTITGGSLTVTLDDTDSALGNPEGDLVLGDQFPVSDAVGKTRTPYSFTLTNSSAKDASYTVYLDPSEVTGTRMADEKIKIYLTNKDGSEVFTDVSTVGSLAQKTRTVNGASVNSRVLYSGVLSHGALDENGNVVTPTTQVFSLRMFISSDAGQEIMGQEYATKVSVDAVQVPERAVVVINGSETKSVAVFEGATATVTITPGTGTPSVSCTNGVTGSVTGSTFTATNVTAHTVCTVTYSG